MKTLTHLLLPKPLSLFLGNKNNHYDCLFYPVEKFALSPDDLPKCKEGDIIQITLRKRKQRYLVSATLYDHSTFNNTYAVLVVPGVGSSSLGAVAFGCEVAEHLALLVDAPKETQVLVLVTGQGIPDLLAEAMEGWFKLGQFDRLPVTYAHAIDIANAYNPYADLLPIKPLTDFQMRSWIPLNEHASVCNLLSEVNVTHIIAHSKGSLITASILETLVDHDRIGRFCNQKTRQERQTKLNQLSVVTLGAVTKFNLPHRAKYDLGNACQLKSVHQFLGEHDHLGKVNSTLTIPYTEIPCTGHSLNPSIQGGQYCEGCKQQSNKWLCHWHKSIHQQWQFALSLPVRKETTCPLFTADEHCGPISIEHVFQAVRLQQQINAIFDHSAIPVASSTD